MTLHYNPTTGRTKIDQKVTSEDIKIIKSEIAKAKPILQRKLGIPIKIKFDKRKTTCGMKGGVIYLSYNAIKVLAADSHKTVRQATRHILTHESMHAKGLDHSKAAVKKGFYSNISKDTYTDKVMKKFGIV